MKSNTNVNYGSTQPPAVNYGESYVTYATNIQSHTDSEGLMYYTADTVEYTHKEYSAVLHTENQDNNDLMVEIVSGTVSQQSKARLYARQIHEGKVTYPSGVPADLRADVYTAYTEHYKYQPALPVMTTLAEAYVVDDIQMVLTDGSMFPSEGTVTVADTEHSTVIEFSDHKGNDLGGCRCIDGDKGVTYAAGSAVKLN